MGAAATGAWAGARRARPLRHWRHVGQQHARQIPLIQRVRLGHEAAHVSLGMKARALPHSLLCVARSQSSVAEAVCPVAWLSAGGLVLTVRCMHAHERVNWKQMPRSEAGHCGVRVDHIGDSHYSSGPACVSSRPKPHPEEAELHQLRRRGPVIGLLAQARVHHLLERLPPNTRVAGQSLPR